MGESQSLENRVRTLLENIPDPFPDFVFGTMVGCKTDEDLRRMLSFLEENEGNLTTDDVANFLADEIMNVPYEDE